MSCNNPNIANQATFVVTVPDNNTITITDLSKYNVVTAIQQVSNVIQINTPGPQGAAGREQNTGSLLLTSSFNSWTGSSTSQFAGTASYSTTSSYSISSSYAFSSSYALSSSYSVSSSYATTSSYSTSSSYANSSSYAESGSYALSASNAFNSTSASYSLSSSYAISSSYAVSASYASTASYVNPLNQNVIITGSILMTGSSYISEVDYIQFDTTAANTSAVGKLYWNNTDGTLELGLKGGTVKSELGQGLVTRIVNQTSPSVDLLGSNYQVVVVAGAQGQRLGAKLAQADNDANSAGTLGVVAEDIAKNQEGFIITVGLLKNINTTGSNGENWNDGDILYLSPTIPGGMTKIKPQAPQHTVIVGYVEYAHQNNGKIYVKIDNGYEIDELHNVKITTSSLDTGDLLIYSSSVWINAKQLTGSYAISGSLTVSGSSTFTNIGPAIFSGSVTSTSGFTGSFSGSYTGTIANATTASYITSSFFTGVNAAQSASYALTASYALNGGGSGDTSGLVTTSSFNAFTSSVVTTSSFNSFTQSINNSTGSFATTGANTFTGNQIINGNVNINGTASISYLNVTYESASVIYSSGSNQFGDATNDIQTLIGRVIISGSLETTGSTNIPNLTGSLFGTASWAGNASTSSYIVTAQTASYVLNAISSSFASTSSYVNTLNQSVIISGSSTVRSTLATGTAFQVLSGSSPILHVGTDVLRTRVGIRTASPQFSFDVNGNANFKPEEHSGYLRIEPGQSSTWNNPTFFQTSFGSTLILNNAYYTASGGQFIRATNGYAAGMQLEPSAGGIELFTAPYGTAGTAFSAFTSRISITNSGSVGINNTLPSYSLDVSGSGRFLNGLIVTGSLSAPSITGSLQGTASWAYSASNYTETDPIFVEKSASLATTGSNTFIGNQKITGSLRVIEQNIAPTIASFKNYTGYGIDLLAIDEDLAGNYDAPIGSIGNQNGNLYLKTGSTINDWTPILYDGYPNLTASYISPTFISASAAASGFGSGGGTTNTGSLLLTASIVGGNNTSNQIEFTKGNGDKFTITVNTGSASGTSGAGANITASFTNQSTWTFTHALGNRGVVVQTFDTGWNQIIPQNITLTDANTATITFPTAESGFAIATLGGVTSIVNASSSISASFASTASFVTPYEGAWTTYTPSWSTPSNPQPSIGDGTLTGAYKQIGKTVFVRVRLEFGTTTSGGTGDWLFGLPVTASVAAGIQFPCSILDAGVTWYQATVNGQYRGDTWRTAIIGQSAGGSNASQGITSVFPITWGTSDSLQFNGSYEAI